MPEDKDNSIREVENFLGRYYEDFCYNFGYALQYTERIKDYGIFDCLDCKDCDDCEDKAEKISFSIFLLRIMNILKYALSCYHVIDNLLTGIINAAGKTLTVKDFEKMLKKGRDAADSDFDNQLFRMKFDEKMKLYINDVINCHSNNDEDEDDDDD